VKEYEKDKKSKNQFPRARMVGMGPGAYGKVWTI
jgi:hypothetical protein